ncbi:MAG TPA: sulfotransferase [Gammaproteobacteria bacterium]
MSEPRQILFIVGMPRSGTKLLRDLLNRHPDIAIFPNESHFFPRMPALIRKHGDPRLRECFARLYAELEGTRFMRRLRAGGIAIDRDDWFARVRGGGAADVLDALFACYAAMTGRRIVGDKTPDYLTEVPVLSGFFPDARFVHIVRDPRDYVVSMRKAWGKSLPRAAQRWKTSIRKLRHDVARADVDFIELRYEDLVTSPRDVLGRLCAFIGVPFCDAMLSLERPSENLGDTRGETSIVASNFGKWRRELGDGEVRRVERIAGAVMAELGYPPEHEAGDEDVPSWLLAACRVRDGLGLVRFGLRHGGIAGALAEAVPADRSLPVFRR